MYQLNNDINNLGKIFAVELENPNNYTIEGSYHSKQIVISKNQEEGVDTGQ